MLYVLHGAWDSQSEDGVIVLGVSVDIKPLQKRLDEIAKNKAREYVGMYGYIQEECGERRYEAKNTSGKYAKFYITEHNLDIPESLMRMMSREMEMIDRSRDIGEYIFGLYETGGMEPWLYEYMANSEEVMGEILQMFDEWEDCNTSFNTTLENVVEKVRAEISLTDEVLGFLWRRLGDTPVDDDGCLTECFMDYEIGTDREEIWSWFDEHHSKGVVALMYDGMD